MSDTLPKSKVTKSYTTAVAARYPGRGRIARVHIVEVTSVKIGNDYRGRRIMTRYPARTALCGVVTADPRHTQAAVKDATCPRCKAQFKIVTCPACASGTGQHACGLSGLQAQLRIGGR